MFAALNTAVFPTDFDAPTLIIVYAMLILGGAGSIGGASSGAVVVNVSLRRLLRTPGHRNVGLLRPDRGRRSWSRCGPGAGSPWSSRARPAFGFAVHAIVAAISASAARARRVDGMLGAALRHWVVLPSNPRAGRLGLRGAVAC